MSATSWKWPNTRRNNNLILRGLNPDLLSLQGILWMSPWLHQWDGSGVGGSCPSLAFPSWIIMALGVSPSFPCSASTLPPLSQFLICVQWGLAVHCPILFTYTCTHSIKSSWAGGSMNSGKSWLCRPSVKSLSRVIYYRESVCTLSPDSHICLCMRHFPCETPTINSLVWFCEWLLILPGKNNSSGQTRGVGGEDRLLSTSAT